MDQILKCIRVADEANKENVAIFVSMLHSEFVTSTKYIAIATNKYTFYSDVRSRRREVLLKLYSTYGLNYMVKL